MGLEEQFNRYRGLIGWAANKYRSIATIVTQEDMFQEGCAFLVWYFTKHPVVNAYVANKFKRSLFLYLHTTARRAIREAQPAGRPPLRIDYHHMIDDDENDDNVINIDDILAVVDTSVLVRMYAKEFVTELRSLLQDDERVIFDMLLESVEADEACNGKVVKRAGAELNISRSAVYAKIVNIRGTALRVLRRSA